LHLNTNKPSLHSIVLHLEAIGDSCGHFLNVYINLHLKDKLDFFLSASTFAFVVDPCNEVFIYVPSPMPLALDLGFHFNFDVVAFASFPFIHDNVPLGMRLLRGLIMNFLLGSQF
jgi:hypothetical protein